jgi:DNA-dependent RNA polymerase auxiliary subunit epsilon
LDDTDTDTNADEIYVVVDMTQYTLLAKERDIVPVTPYEILISREVLEVMVHPDVTNFFMKLKENSGTLDVHHIKREDGTYLESPYVLYLCKSNGAGGYENISDIAEDIADIVYPRVSHEILGSTLLFTSRPFATVIGSPNLLRRFVVFAEKAKTLYIEADSDTKLEDVYADNAVEYHVISFMENATFQYWSVSTSLIVDTLE